MNWLVWLAIRTVVFGIALTFITKVVSGVKVEPRNQLPWVAFVFAILNSALYWFLKGSMNVVTLWMLFLVTPLLANMVILWLSDKLLKPLKIEGMKALF